MGGQEGGVTPGSAHAPGRKCLLQPSLWLLRDTRDMNASCESRLETTGLEEPPKLFSFQGVSVCALILGRFCSDFFRTQLNVHFFVLYSSAGQGHNQGQILVHSLTES